MKPSICFCLSMLMLGTIGMQNPNSITKEKSLLSLPPAIQETVFELGLSLMLTGNYQEADLCFSKLWNEGEKSVEILNNQGVNQVMHGLSLLKEDEADSIVKYVFPFEVSPDLRSKGNDDTEKQRKEKIRILFVNAGELFEQCIKEDKKFASGYLNAAAAHVLLSRWVESEDYLIALDRLDSARALAKKNNYMTTLGYADIIEGILNHYLGQVTRRDELFERAGKNSNARVSELSKRNQSISDGGRAMFVSNSGEHFDSFGDVPESIDGISLGQVIKSSNLPVDSELINLDSIKVYQKAYQQSYLYVFFKSPSQFFLFHKTQQTYIGKSGKQIKIGANEAAVRIAYGRPFREQAARNGKYLYYKKAKMIFFIGGDETVRHWLVWRGKKA